MRFDRVMFIYTYTDVEGSESQRVAGEIDHVMKPAFGDRPGVNARQGTGPRLSARMLQEYEAAHRELVNGIVTEEMVQLVQLDNYGVGLYVKSPCGLTLCHAVQGNAVTARLDIEDMHYHQQWSGAPMEVIDRSRVVESARVFLEHAAEWRDQLAAAFKADSKGVKMRNMAMNNMDAYLSRYFDGTGITYYFDKRHADGHKMRLLVHLNRYKTTSSTTWTWSSPTWWSLPIWPVTAASSSAARCVTTGNGPNRPRSRPLSGSHRKVEDSRDGCATCSTATVNRSPLASHAPNCSSR